MIFSSSVVFLLIQTSLSSKPSGNCGLGSYIQKDLQFFIFLKCQLAACRQRSMLHVQYHFNKLPTSKESFEVPYCFHLNANLA